MPLAARARRNQTLTEIDQLITEFTSWLESVTAEQYETQLSAIKSEVVGAATIIRAEAANLSVEGKVGVVYGRCAQIDKQVTWLRRVWYYFRDKFNQRSDARFAATLQAADQVVWSCYRPFFKAASDQRIPEPAPLPYIETEYSPMAVRRDQHQVLASKTKEFTLVRSAFESLPVPILKLPVSVVANPWMLALIGHETGHFVQPLVASDGDFVKTFKAAVASAVDPKDADVWGRWSVEIFADWYSILTVGTDALWTMAQCEAVDAAAFHARRTAYPSPVVRLELMAALADAYGLEGAATLANVGIELPASGESIELDEDRRAVGPVAKAIRSLSGCEDLREQIGLHPTDFAARGLVDQWADYLKGEGAQPVSNKPNSARRVVAGTARAWDTVVFAAVARDDGAAVSRSDADAESPSEEVLENLRSSAQKAMTEAAAPGVRSSSAATESGPEPGRKLKDLLTLAADDEAEGDD